MAEIHVATMAEVLTGQPWLAAAPASVILQCVAILRHRGAMRAVNVILAVVTGSIGAFAMVAYATDPGNLWQLVLGMTSPPILVLTIGTLLMGLLVGTRRSQPARPGTFD